MSSVLPLFLLRLRSCGAIVHDLYFNTSYTGSISAVLTVVLAFV